MEQDIICKNQTPSLSSEESLLVSGTIPETIKQKSDLYCEYNCVNDTYSQIENFLDPTFKILEFEKAFEYVQDDVMEAIKLAFTGHERLPFQVVTNDYFHTYFEYYLQEQHPVFKDLFSNIYNLMCLNEQEYFSERSKVNGFRSIDLLRYACLHLKKDCNSEQSFSSNRMMWLPALIKDCGLDFQQDTEIEFTNTENNFAKSKPNLWSKKLHMVCEYKLEQILTSALDIRKAILLPIKMLESDMTVGLGVLTDKECIYTVGIKVGKTLTSPKLKWARICTLQKFDISCVEGMCKAFVFFMIYSLATKGGSFNSLNGIVNNLRKEPVRNCKENKTDSEVKAQTNSGNKSSNATSNPYFGVEQKRKSGKDTKLLLQKKKVIQERSRKILQEVTNFIK